MSDLSENRRGVHDLRYKAFNIRLDVGGAPAKTKKKVLTGIDKLKYDLFGDYKSGYITQEELSVELRRL